MWLVDDRRPVERQNLSRLVIAPTPVCLIAGGSQGDDGAAAAADGDQLLRREDSGVAVCGAGGHVVAGAKLLAGGRVVPARTLPLRIAVRTSAAITRYGFGGRAGATVLPRQGVGLGAAGLRVRMRQAR
jgi:hypothetical protein